MPLLVARQLVKSYEGRRVVDRVSLQVDAGEIVGLLGRNGAGKTTTFRMVIGMITPEEGQVTFRDSDVTRLPMYRHARAGMGYLSQEPSVFQRLTVHNNLLAILETQRLTRAARHQRAKELLEQFGLQHKANEQARTCSGGERRRLEIARALVTRPKLMLLDEPFAGVDPHTVEELQDEVRKLAADGIAVLVTDHNVQQTMRICDRASIIHDGKNLREGTPREIINDPLVREAYLASTFRGDEFDERPHRPSKRERLTAEQRRTHHGDAKDAEKRQIDSGKGLRD
ncbi:MAG: LPS export ABC transporter ATP-binding protein [Planctomycetota bacterium]